MHHHNTKKEEKKRAAYDVAFYDKNGETKKAVATDLKPF
jgi:hypothetical protein